jgi:hypothetical protein
VAVIAATGGAPSALAAKAATSTIPIVFTAGSNPVRAGLVPSLNRPGGNVTGVSFLTDALAAKRLGLVREIMREPGTIAVLINPQGPAAAGQLKDIQSASHRAGKADRQLSVLGADRRRQDRGRQAARNRDGRRADPLRHLREVPMSEIARRCASVSSSFCRCWVRRSRYSPRQQRCVIVLPSINCSAYRDPEKKLERRRASFSLPSPPPETMDVTVPY